MNKTLQFAGSLAAVVLLAMPIALFAQADKEGKSDTEIGVDVAKGTFEKVSGIRVLTSPSEVVEKTTGIPLSYGSVAEDIAEAVGAESMKGPIGVAVDLTLNPSSIATDEAEGSPQTMEIEKNAFEQWAEDHQCPVEDREDPGAEEESQPTMQQYQALQNVSNWTMQRPMSHDSGYTGAAVWQNMPSRSVVQQSRGPQIMNGYPSDCVPGGGRCR